MNIDQMPMNFSLVNNHRGSLSTLSAISSTDIYDGISGQLNNQGLFSPTIFGRVGEKRRQSTLAYIDLQTKIFHPLIYRNISKISSFYEDIINGRKHAKWDEKAFDFVEADEMDGETGYGYFAKYFPLIKFTRNDSDQRNLRIDVIEKYRLKCMYDFYLVLPAGIRDIEEDQKGNVTQDEINDIYRAMIGLSRNIDKQYPDSEFNDTTRRSLQRNANDLYNLLFGRIEGKRGLIQNKYLKRRIENGTRSVLTAMNFTTANLEGPQAISGTDTVIGLYMGMKSALPKTIHAIKNCFVKDLLGGNDGFAFLINKKTLKEERVAISTLDYDMWTSNDGINDLINKYRARFVRDKPAVIGKHYLSLIYMDKFGFRLLRNIDDISKERQKDVRPMTWSEFFYYVSIPHINKLPLFVTRYPVNNKNSMAPSFSHIRTTVTALALREYDENFSFKTEEVIYNQWPISGEGYIDSLIPHTNKLADLNAEQS